MPDLALRGDLRERLDGAFEGWCWAPDRPTARLVVDLMVNETVAASIVAAIFRRDLQLGGVGDGRHAFVLRLPPNLAETDGEHIVTARERQSGTVFGRVLRAAGGAAPGSDRLERLGQSVEALWQQLEAARAANAPPPPADRLRGALGTLSRRLAGRATPDQPTEAILLPDLAAPALTIILHARDAAATSRRIAALAPAAPVAGAEVIAVDPGADPFAALLPAQVHGLRYFRDGRATTRAAAANLAADSARGARLLLLDDRVAHPSAAALLALAAAAARAEAAVLMAATLDHALVRAGEPAPPLAARLDRRLGVLACIDRALWPALGPLDLSLDDGAGLACADLALRARLLRLDVGLIAEPAAGATADEPAAPAATGAAMAAFRARWGAAALDPSPARA